MRRFRAIAMLAFFLILTSVSFADDTGVRSRESFNASWRFARFGPMADRSTRPEPGAERWSIVASASSEEIVQGERRGKRVRWRSGKPAGAPRGEEPTSGFSSTWDKIGRSAGSLWTGSFPS